MKHRLPIIEKDRLDPISGIKAGDRQTLQRIYQDNYNTIAKMVTGFQHISITPEDVFQEGLTRAVLNIRHDKFQGNSSFDTYLYGICRNICLVEYKRQRPLFPIDKEPAQEDNSPFDFESIEILMRAKDQLDPICVTLLNLRFGLGKDSTEQGKNRPFEEVASLMELTPENARQRFGRCMNKLRMLISDLGLETLIRD